MVREHCIKPTNSSPVQKCGNHSSRVFDERSTEGRLRFALLLNNFMHMEYLQDRVLLFF